MNEVHVKPRRRMNFDIHGWFSAGTLTVPGLGTLSIERLRLPQEVTTEVLMVAYCRPL